MHKPGSLRAALTQSLDPRHGISRNPDRLHMTIVSGRPWALGAPGQAKVFELRYVLRITLLDFAGGPEEVIFPLLDWIGRWQVELLRNHDSAREGFDLEVEFLNNKTVDILVDLPLTERARREADGTVAWLDEPEPFGLEAGAPLEIEIEEP